MDFNRLVTNIEILKNRAKLARDANDIGQAIAALSDAIAMIEGWKYGASEPGEMDRKIAAHCADCFGMLGSTYRRVAQHGEPANRAKFLRQAIGCFERGRVYEQDPRYDIAGLYNTVNAIAASIEGGFRDASSQKAELEQAVIMLKRQVSDPKSASRGLDRWAWADLGQCQLLLGDEAGAKASYTRFIELGDPTTVQFSIKVLRRILDALRTTHDDATAAVVARGIEQLETAASAANRPGETP